ncbi:MAG: tetraacyldisaccharide 4'-kinase, partial [Alphaproteobacteria bacterium]|nr:tetraacyldisaccharide 4'-kinase [Alphaproteobacteria bacterium]
GFGNNFLIPAGPMRETLHSGLKKADLVVLIGEASDDLQKKLVGKKIVRAKILPTNLEKFRGKKLLAFCGLAYPKKFFSLLEQQGINVVETCSFSDHYNYQIHDLENLYQLAKGKNLELVTTKKDWVKFPKIFQENISYLDVELVFEDESELRAALTKILK